VALGRPGPPNALVHAISQHSGPDSLQSNDRMLSIPSIACVGLTYGARGKERKRPSRGPKRSKGGACVAKGRVCVRKRRGIALGRCSELLAGSLARGNESLSSRPASPSAPRSKRELLLLPPFHVTWLLIYNYRTSCWQFRKVNGGTYPLSRPDPRGREQLLPEPHMLAHLAHAPDAVDVRVRADGPYSRPAMHSRFGRSRLISFSAQLRT